MNKEKRIPEPAELRDYNHAVAGHAGTLCDADGELFIKPCTQAEIEFYQSATHYHPEFAEIMPLYMGSLILTDPSSSSRLNLDQSVAGLISDAGQIQNVTNQLQATLPEQVSRASAAPAAALPDAVSWVPNHGKKIKTNTAVVLENAASGFAKPNILDVKLGTRLWADDAPAVKRARLDKVTHETTHETLGFRIAGMRVFDGSSSSSSSSSDAPLLDDEGYRVYDKDYGRLTLNKDNVVDGFRRFVFHDAAGVDDELGRAVCAAFVQEIARVQEVLEKHETRMYSSSLLFVFEGDGEALRRAIERNNEVVAAVEEKPAHSLRHSHSHSHRTALRTDSGIALDDGDVEFITAAVSGDEDGDDGDGDGLDSEEEDTESMPRILALKLIDFAHAQWTPGQGSDENLLKGVRGLRSIFEKLALE